MRPIQFRKRLFGFSRRQVMDYLAEADREYQAERQALTRTFSDRLEEQQRQLEEANRQRDALLRQNEVLRVDTALALGQADSLRRQMDDLSAKLEDQNALHARLRETEAECEAWQHRFAALEADIQTAANEARERENRLAAFIDRLQQKNADLLQRQMELDLQLTDAERRLIVEQGVPDPPADEAEQAQRGEILTALEAILHKMDGKEPSSPIGRVFRLADPD